MFPNTKKNLCLYGQTLSYYTRKEIPSGKSGIDDFRSLVDGNTAWDMVFGVPVAVAE
jgi:hypothetical protein